MFPQFFAAIIVDLMISLTPYSLENPVEVSGEDYNKLVQMKEKGWSHCDSKEECLAKLHYLRAVFAKGKIAEGDYHEREEKMVDETDNEHEALLILKCTAVGIASETLADAADVAKRLCTQSGPVDGGTLDPRHYIDYQHLFLKLARKTSI